jgi:hypothetical protein
MGMEGFIGEFIGALVWLVANVVYLDSRRKGTRGFRRLLAFWMGLPVTWFTLLVVKEASAPRIEPPPDDEEGLLAEVRRDRALRAGSESRQEPGRIEEES